MGNFSDIHEQSIGLALDSVYYTDDKCNCESFGFRHLKLKLTDLSDGKALLYKQVMKVMFCLK